MRPGVISDDVPGRSNSPHEFRLRIRSAAQQKKSCTDSVARQNIQQLWRPRRVRPVVKE